MSPTQAREIIEAAAERIAEWKSRLRINTGRGVESWDNKTGQMVSVRVPGREMVKEPVVFTNYLWVSTSRVSVLDPVYVPSSGSTPSYLLAEGMTIREATGWYTIGHIANLFSGEYFAEDQYKHPDDVVASDVYAGYYDPKFGSIYGFAPSDNGYPVYPTGNITLGAIYRPQLLQTGLTEAYEFEARTNTSVTVNLSIRGYSPDYLADRENRGLKPEFAKGQSVGAFDLMIRQYDEIQGPPVYIPPYTDVGGTYWPGGTVNYTNPLLSSWRSRVGFAPVTMTFRSRANGPHTYSPGWTSRGDIALMAYRKV